MERENIALKKLQANLGQKESANKDKRKQRGKADRSVIFPVAPAKAELPNEYIQWFADLKTSISQQKLQIVLASNEAMVLLYWDIGQRILDKQENKGWGG